MGKRRPKPPIERGTPVVVKIATADYSHALPLHRSEDSRFEFLGVLERKSRYDGASAPALTVGAISE